jgi:hypothetical protein
MIIGISGKIGSGKNSVATIIQGLNMSLDKDMIIHQIELGKPFGKESGFEQKAFAAKLKQIVSILTGISVEDLEKQEVKDRLLGEEWDRTISNGFKVNLPNEMRKITVRQMLQWVGTDAMRDVIHPNIWVNALFADYRQIDSTWKDGNNPYIGEFKEDKPIFPNWIITDLRFPNELKTIKQRSGITIRVNRELPCEVCKLTKDEKRGKICNEIACPQGRKNYQGNHISETALDDYKDWDYVINNNSDIPHLIKEVEKMLKHFNLI